MMNANKLAKFLYEGECKGDASVGIANPASVNCEKLGGKLTIKEGTGGQYGECALPSGKICEERALYRGECKN
jgi:putative hemolysin